MTHPNINYIHDNEKRTSEIYYDEAIVKIFVTLNGVCSLDGDSFIALIGQDLQSGCTGIGNFRIEAIRNCIHNFYNEDSREIYNKKHGGD